MWKVNEWVGVKERDEALDHTLPGFRFHAEGVHH